MEILPILSTLRRHKITALLVILEIALACAIVCNAVFLITQRLQRMDMPSGVAEHELVQIQVANIGNGTDAMAQAEEDLATLRRVAGVKSVALVDQVPFANSSWNGSIKLDPDQKHSTLNATQYYGENLLRTFGTQLVAGRYFNAGDYRNFDDVIDGRTEPPSTMIITRALAQRLWPGESPLGKTIYQGNDPARVVGVVASLIRPSLSNGDDTAQWSIVYPMRMAMDHFASYVLRSTPGDREKVIKAAVAALKANNPKRVIVQKRTLDDMRTEFFQGDRAMTGLLAGVCLALLVVTALGIIGLASFWVSQRRRMIGVRRALGATRGNILRYFQTENLLLVTIGIVLGMVLAYGINLFLMQRYELPRLPWSYLPTGAITLWLIGQLSILGPALRASHVPPVVATRSV